MRDLTDDELDAALLRGEALASSDPRARSVAYNAETRRVVVNLENGCVFEFPALLAQGLEGASETDLSSVQVTGDGYGLHWETLDVDFTVPGLMAGVFGTNSYMARRGGRATSFAKAAAARENGRKGGRPRKTAA